MKSQTFQGSVKIDGMEDTTCVGVVDFWEHDNFTCDEQLLDAAGILSLQIEVKLDLIKPPLRTNSKNGCLDWHYEKCGKT